MAKDKKFDLQPYLDKINSFDPNDIDWENMGSWPAAGKAVFCAVIGIAIIVGGYFYMLEPMQQKLSREVQKESQLKKDFENKAFQAANLEAYKEQMIELGAQLITSGGMAETAEAARLKHSSDVSDLEVISDNISRAYNKSGQYDASFKHASIAIQNDYPFGNYIMGTHYSFGDGVDETASGNRAMQKSPSMLNQPPSAPRPLISMPVLSVLLLDTTVQAVRLAHALCGTAATPAFRRSYKLHA